MKTIKNVDPEIYNAIVGEVKRQNNGLEMIASENFVSKAVLEAIGSVFTNKYAEGYPSKRYYGGCVNADIVENLARDRAKELFRAEHINVQPHSGSQANIAAFTSVLKTGQKILGMDLAHGGHLTHGSPVNFSGNLFNIASYGVKKETGRIDYDEVRDIALRENPDLILAGFSAYPRQLDFKIFRDIADETGAYLMADIAHIAGLIAAKEHPDPVPYCHIITTTTHKTLRGPRGGLIILGPEALNKYEDPWSGKMRRLKKSVDSRVFPGNQGGPLVHCIAAKAIAFYEALQPEFKTYIRQVIKNAAVLGDELINRGFNLVSNGTDNHLMLVDLSNKDVTGRDAEVRLEEAGITVNKNMVPFDKQKPTVTSGIRVGTPALTTRGMKEEEMKVIGGMMDKVVSNINDDSVIAEVRREINDLCERFPLYDFI